MRRVRDWNGQTWYTTCAESLQSPTDVALERMICRTMEERPNENSRTKYQGASRAKDQAAGGAEDMSDSNCSSVQRQRICSRVIITVELKNYIYKIRRGGLRTTAPMACIEDRGKAPKKQ